jgi:hypothetical protein
MKWDAFHNYNVQMMIRGEATSQNQFEALAYKSVVIDPEPKDEAAQDDEVECDDQIRGEDFEPKTEYQEEIDHKIESSDESNFNPFYDTEERHNNKKRKRLTAKMVLASYVKKDPKRQLKEKKADDEEAAAGLDQDARRIKHLILFGKINIPPEMKNASLDEMIAYVKRQRF